MKKWWKFFLLYFGGVLVTLSQLKIVPVMDELSVLLNVSVSELTLLMSVFSLAGLLLAIPGGAVLSKFGGKKLALSIMFFLCVGNLLGAFAITSSFPLLLISRVIEGMAFSVIVMIGVVLINYWFPESETGLPIGIYGTFSAFGSMVAMNIFRPMMSMFGVTSLWYSCAVLSILGFLLFLFFIDAPQTITKEKGEKSSVLLGLKKSLENKGVVILSFAQGCMAFVLFTFLTIYPLIFMSYYSLSPEDSNFYTSLFGLFGIPFGAVAGFIIDKSGKPGLVTFLSFLLMTVATLWMAFLGGTASYIGQVFLLSTGISLASTCVYITVSRIVTDKSLLGYSMSFVSQMYYIGVFIGAPIVTRIAESTNWQMGIFSLVFVSALGTLGTLYYFFQSKPA